MNASFDPITLDIIQNSLQAISDEMFAAMRKTAMSAIIYEVLDMGTGITDGQGNLVSSGAGIPAFVGVLDKAVQRVIGLYPEPGQINSGDVFITNDPYYGGVTHLNDIVLLMPVFAGTDLIAWTANIAHWNDVGGMVPGSMSPDAKEIFQEGLRLPAVKLIDAGRTNQSVMDILRGNSRMPEFLHGDLWAGIAAVRIGAKRVRELAGKYGTEVFDRAMRHFMDYGEQTALKALRELPPGTYQIAQEQDSGAVYSVTVQIADDKFVVDLRDNPDQEDGPNNASRDGTLTVVQMIFKNITDRYGPCNAGSFRPIELLTREGSVFDARAPAAMGIYYEVEMAVYDLIWRCLAPHLGDRLPSGHFASICATIIGGVHPETGRHFSVIEPQVGGWGGSSRADGNCAVFCGMHGETYNCPVEIAETRYGLYVDRLALNENQGGEGEFRGGHGIELEYRIRSDGSFLTASYSRHKHKPWAMHGGHEGSPNYIEVIRKEGGVERYGMVSALTVNAGDVIRIVTASGGGFGDPINRPLDKVANDLRDGYITNQVAQDIYRLSARH